MFIDFSDHGFSTHHTSRQGPLSGRTDDGSRLRSSEWLISFHAQLKRFHDSAGTIPTSTSSTAPASYPPAWSVQPFKGSGATPSPARSSSAASAVLSAHSEVYQVHAYIDFGYIFKILGFKHKWWLPTNHDHFRQIEWRLGVLLLLQKVTKTPTFYLMLQLASIKFTIMVPILIAYLIFS